MRTPAEEIFVGLANWQDADIALAQAGDLSGCLHENGDVDVDAVAAVANRLVLDKPYLKRSNDSDAAWLPHLGPTGMPVGSGRRRYGQPAYDEDALKRKYPALNAGR